MNFSLLSLSLPHTLHLRSRFIVFLQKSSNPRKSYISRFSNRSPNETDKVINVLHPGRPNVSKTELKEKLSRLYDVNDTNAIFVFKFITHFGGGKSTGFCLIYDSVENAKKFEPKYRLIRNGLDTKIEKSRKQLKEKEQSQENLWC